MEQHVFAVWDFMALLKALQFGLTSTNAPWMPIGNPKTRRLINEIVLEEESDMNMQGEPSSHYEMYLDAMEQCGADTTQVKRLIDRLLAGYNHEELIAFNVEQLEDYTLEFVKSTFKIIHKGALHEIASAFTFDLIAASKIVAAFCLNSSDKSESPIKASTSDLMSKESSEDFSSSSL